MQATSSHAVVNYYNGSGKQTVRTLKNSGTVKRAQFYQYRAHFKIITVETHCSTDEEEEVLFRWTLSSVDCLLSLETKEFQSFAVWRLCAADEASVHICQNIANFITMSDSVITTSHQIHFLPTILLHPG